ncbi:uncharacterized protein K02A2.6-like [Centruroides sculpturatus]|uniref:uncharacterized protein K02A2.6-like n=1 Tax=Centruroides sculpturatus TaxID=218467 RepID=UPI000C6D0C80|nr:uncharacterized protein K02A2.6-like [Centruroides sculpturatus]
MESDVEAQVNLINYCSITPKKFEKLRHETKRDKELQSLINIIKEGWPEQKNMIDPLVKPYWKFREDLSEVRGIVCKGEQIVIPKSMRAETIDRLHYNHMGISKTLWRAKEHVFWPFMEKEIIDVVRNCPACLKYQNSNPKETLINRELSTRPWEIVTTDICHLFGKDYLLVVDTFSRFPEVYCMNQNTTHSRIVEAMKSIFSRHGKPEIIYSGNDTQFVNKHFQQFLEHWEITHKTSSPRNPQSNGFIERHVQTIKKLLKKAVYDSKDIYLTLLEYRNTPLGRGIPSPAQLLYGRRLRGQVPTRNNLLKPRIVVDKFRKNHLQRQQIQKHYFDRNARDLTALNPHDRVMIQIDKRNWEPGEIIEIDRYRPRSYIVRIDKDGKYFICNRRFLRKFNVNRFRNIQNHSGELLDQPIEDEQASEQGENMDSSRENFSGREEKDMENEQLENQEVSGNEATDLTTRSGRVIRRPSRFKDFV